MRLSCGVVKDLLLLYEEGLCCEESRRLIDAHLKECAECSAYLKRLKLPEEMQIGEEAIPPEIEKASIRKSFRKIKRRWVISLICTLLLLPLGAAVGTMAYHEYRQDGICFSNIDEILLCRKFLRLMQKGAYPEAAQMLDFESKYYAIMEALDDASKEEGLYQWYLNWYHRYYEIEDISHYYGISDISQMTAEEFAESQRQDFVEYLTACTSTIQSIRFHGAYHLSDDWDISYRITEKLEDPEALQTVGISFRIQNGKLIATGAFSPDSTVETKSVLGAVFRDWRKDYFGREEENMPH